MGVWMWMGKLRLTFVASEETGVLGRYLAGECCERDGRLFPQAEVKPTEEDVLQAVGWCPSQTRGENEDWEDVQWGIREVKEDIRDTMRKGAREWVRWCKGFEKDPEKALNKA